MVGMHECGPRCREHRAGIQAETKARGVDLPCRACGAAGPSQVFSDPWFEAPLCSGCFRHIGGDRFEVSRAFLILHGAMVQEAVEDAHARS